MSGNTLGVTALQRHSSNLFYSVSNFKLKCSVKAVLHGTICMIRFVWLLFGFKISSYKSEEIELILSFKNRIIQILMQKVVTIFQFTRSD